MTWKRSSRKSKATLDFIATLFYVENVSMTNKRNLFLDNLDNVFIGHDVIYSDSLW